MSPKYLKLAVLAVLMLLMTGCASTGGKLVGAWEMLDENGNPVGKKKILTEDHFAFGEQTGPASIWAGGGTWKLEDDLYFETVEYHSAPAVVGKTLKFDCRVVDGVWYHEGRFKAGGETFHVDEVWRKIKKD